MIKPHSIRRLLIPTPICFALAAVLLECNFSEASAAEPPRERVLLDSGWRFHLGDAPDAGSNIVYTEVRDLAKTRIPDLGIDPGPGIPTNDISFARVRFNDSSWRQLDLPHDWIPELPFDSKSNPDHGFKPTGPAYTQNSVGWYRHTFEVLRGDRNKQLWLEFDGVSRDSIVWLNGHCLGRHPSGYSSFRHDITPFVKFGGKNLLVVRVDVSRFEGWFYEGAGIYRHVWLEKAGPVHFAPDGIFVWSQFSNNIPEGGAEIKVQSQLVNASDASADATVTQEILNSRGESIAKRSQDGTVAAHGDSRDESAMTIPSPDLWSPESPTLYRLVTTLESRGKTLDRVETEFGVRTVAFDAEKGFLLNGRPYVIKGTCNHQDHAGVGAAMPDALQYFRVRKLKEMGSNAYRTSHNAPTPELLEACDRLGMLVMDENRRMDTNAMTLGNLEVQILRDRNHPSVFVWSLGNEEHNLQGSGAGHRVFEIMQNLVHKLDPTRLCTAAMDGNWGRGFTEVMDVQGFNYHTGNINAFHESHTNLPEIGTETASTVCTRGIYSDSKALGYVSAFGDDHPGWAAKPWEWWPFYATHPYTSGGFIWTGFDYRGEPTPYQWPCINSHFGLMDTCGFPKDIYYYYQAWWTEKPVLHVAPHWNWAGNEGQTNLVRVFSNCKEVELFLNGQSLGKQTMDANSYLDWHVAYQPGVLSAKGYRDAQMVAEAKVETTGAPAAVQLSPDRLSITSDGRDVSVIDVSVVDDKGRVVPIADNLIRFKLKGLGTIIGVGNGDPSSHESDKANQRKVFNGYAQVIVQSKAKSGVMELTAISEGLRGTDVKITSKAH